MWFDALQHAVAWLAPACSRTGPAAPSLVYTSGAFHLNLPSTAATNGRAHDFDLCCWFVRGYDVSKMHLPIAAQQHSVQRAQPALNRPVLDWDHSSATAGSRASRTYHDHAGKAKRRAELREDTAEQSATTWSLASPPTWRPTRLQAYSTASWAKRANAVLLGSPCAEGPHR